MAHVQKVRQDIPEFIIKKVLVTCIFCKNFVRPRRLCIDTGKRRNPLYTCGNFIGFTTGTGESN